jgi:hypothetical protein
MQAIYNRHRNVVPVMAMGVAELKEELAHNVGLGDLPEIHQVMIIHSAACGWTNAMPQHAAVDRSDWKYVSMITIRSALHGDDQHRARACSFWMAFICRASASVS